MSDSPSSSASPCQRRRRTNSSESPFMQPYFLPAGILQLCPPDNEILVNNHSPLAQQCAGNVREPATMIHYMYTKPGRKPQFVPQTPRFIWVEPTWCVLVGTNQTEDKRVPSPSHHIALAISLSHYTASKMEVLSAKCCTPILLKCLVWLNPLSKWFRKRVIGFYTQCNTKWIGIPNFLRSNMLLLVVYTIFLNRASMLCC